MMGILEEGIVQRLLETSSSFKRDVMEERIRNLLSAQIFTQVTKLAARRGAADGGIDGTVNITTLLNNAPTPETRAALNIKVRQSAFTREQLGGFLLDMDREEITTGILITAASLAPDADSELKRKNNQGQIRLFHIRLSDILSGAENLPEIFIGGVRIDSILTRNLRDLLDQ
jgi:hypothetical protein